MSVGATTRPAGRTRARVGLTRQRIVAAALDEIDAHGLHSLTMQGLARSLGAGTMSLYNHVRSKDDLLGAVSEHLWADIAGLAPPSDDPARSLAPTSAQLVRHKHGDPGWSSVRGDTPRDLR